MQVKTSELTGAALDWAVAKCEWFEHEDNWQGTYNAPYSTDWAYTGPIIERERINLDGRIGWAPGAKEYGPYFRAWQGADSQDPEGSEFGPTPLIAAMRCYVTSKMGDIVEIPDELK